METLKTLQIVDEPWDSGLTHYALTLSRELQKAGHHVTVAVKPGMAPQKMALRMNLETWPLTWVGALRKKVVSENYQIVNAHTGRGHSAGWLATWGTDARLVRTRGDARPLSRRPFWRLLYRGTHRVIACSEVIKADYLKCLGLPDARVTTIYPAVPTPGLPPPFSEGPLRIGLVARLDPVKGHKDLLEAAAQLKRSHPDFSCIFAGGEAALHIDELKAIARQHGIEKNCSFLGWRNDISEVMRSCDIGVISSIGSEAVSRAALEWMAAGRPVIATKVGCLPELIEDGVTGRLVSPGQPQEIAYALFELAWNKELKVRMGRDGWQKARERFNPERLVSETLRVYREALSNLP